MPSKKIDRGRKKWYNNQVEEIPKGIRSANKTVERYGACGAGVSAGMFVSIITGSTPLEGEAWGLSNKMTSSALGAIGEVGGPRCCKRDSYLAIVKAVELVREYLGVEMELGEIKCSHSAHNNQCIGARCPFQ